MLTVMTTMLAQAAAAATAPLSPDGPWNVAHEEEYCAALRPYTHGGTTIFVGVKPVTWGDVGDVLMVVPNPRSLPAFATGTGSVVLPDGERIEGRLRSWATGDRKRRLVQIEVPRLRIRQLAEARELTVSAEGRSIHVRQNGSRAVARALDDCETSLKASTESVARTDAVIVPRDGESAAAVASGNPAYWIRASDYPEGAIERGYQGATGVRWVIEPDGRVRRCWVTERSDHPALDAVVCRVLRERARYRPARDDDGQPVAQVTMRKVVWRIVGTAFPKASRIPD